MCLISQEVTQDIMVKIFKAWRRVFCLSNTGFFDRSCQYNIYSNKPFSESENSNESDSSSLLCSFSSPEATGIWNAALLYCLLASSHEYYDYWYGISELHRV